MAANLIRYSAADQTLTFRVEGRGTMTQSLPLRRLAERSFDGGTTQLRFDLRECTYMDSTFLGTLLTLKKAVERRQGHLTLLAPSVACVKILQQMGLGDVLPAEATPCDDLAAWHELTGGAEDAGLFKRTVTQAHEELAALPGPAGEQFKTTMKHLEQANKQPDADAK